MIYSFTKQFAPQVASGEKRQTIRAPRNDGKLPTIGETLYLYTGPYLPGERVKIGEAICESVESVRIHATECYSYDDRLRDPRLFWESWMGIKIGESFICSSEFNAFAWADGFIDIAYLLQYLYKNDKTCRVNHKAKPPYNRGNNGGRKGVLFNGHLIKWGDIS